MSKLSLKERLAKKRQELKTRSGSSNVVFPKEGTTRIRILPVGKDADWSFEVTHFYLGAKIKGVFSPSSVGMDCPIMEAYQEFSKDKRRADLAKLLSPRKKFLVPAIVFEDDGGKKVDDARSGKLVMLPGSVWGQMVDFFLDPELGDFTDPVEGYDFKIKRTGTGKTDTEYSISPMRQSAIPQAWRKEVDLEEMVKDIMEPYDEIQSKLDTFLAEESSIGDDDEDEDEKPRPAKKKIKKSRD
jgi:hypothetical protein